MGRRSGEKPHYRRAVGGYIYFIRCPANGYIKIGYSSKHPDARLDVCRRVSPFPVEPLGYFSGWISEEKRLHVRFKSDWSHGEWFIPSEALLSYIAGICKAWEPPCIERNPPFSRVEKPISDRVWGDTTYVKLRGEYRTVAEWRMVTNYGRSLKSIRGLLKKAADPERIFYPSISRRP